MNRHRLSFLLAPLSLAVLLAACQKTPDPPATVVPPRAWAAACGCSAPTPS